MNVSYQEKRRIYQGDDICDRLICFYFFSTPNQVPETFIGLGRVVYPIKALSVFIQTTLEFKKIAI